MIQARQAERLASIIQFARRRSAFYGTLYANQPAQIPELHLLPPTDKSTLMAHFDEWITDPRVNLANVEAFVADPGRVGELFLDQFAVWKTSGTTGHRGIFVHDRHALLVYMALLVSRAVLPWMFPRRARMFVRRGGRIGAIVATGGHYAGAGVMELLQRQGPGLGKRSRIFSVLSPLPELLHHLNQFQPAILLGYPTAIDLIASEQASGRLEVHPVLVITAAEWLDPAARTRIEQAFDCPVRDLYGASEFMGIAFECGHGWLHVNNDWVILEPVDQHYRPVSPGEPSHTVLLTNLANRVQPLIRYDLGDSIVVKPEPCPCGCPLPAIRVSGRRDDILEFSHATGAPVRLLPMAVAAIVEETPGVHRYQIIQVGPACLRVRLDVEAGADPAHTGRAVLDRLQSFLATQGVPQATVELAKEPPQRDPVSGKFRLVWREMGNGGQ